MKKARLIKKDNSATVATAVAGEESGKLSRAATAPGNRSRRQLVAEWLERRRERPDPRQAFAALFLPPRVS